MDYKFALEVQGVSDWYESGKPVLHDINLRIIHGEIVSIVGPSGTGKSTLLSKIIGTHPPKKGKVIAWHGGQAITVLQPSRDEGIVYQNYPLYPYLTALQNVAFGLMLDQTNIPFRIFRPFKWYSLRKQHLEQAAAMLERFGLQDAMNKYPHQLSGGMQQRVAIAQALIMNPDILVFDEPYASLDESAGDELEKILLGLYRDNITAFKEGRHADICTYVVVTHELTRAIVVGDRVIAVSRHWNWQEQGFEECPGTTVVYDGVAPVFDTNDPKDSPQLVVQRKHVRRIAFDSNYLPDPKEHQFFWQQLANGEGRGILALYNHHSEKGGQ